MRLIILARLCPAFSCSHRLYFISTIFFVVVNSPASMR